MGHDFPKDKDVEGNLSILSQKGEKPMCLIPLFLFPTTLIEELLLVVEAVNDFGGWGGRTVSPHPHAPSTHDLDVHLHTQTFIFLSTNC